VTLQVGIDLILNIQELSNPFFVNYVESIAISDRQAANADGKFKGA